MSTLYQLYKQKVFNLAKTTVIKHDLFAQKINSVLALNGHHVDTDPFTWKYYLNLAGEYHPTDRLALQAINRVYEPDLNSADAGHIRIKVAGNFGPVTVNLTKDLLTGPTADDATANEYQFGTQFYKLLVEKYPQFETLILGMLNPIPMEVSIGARDNVILYAGGYLLTFNSPGYIDPEQPVYEKVSRLQNKEDLIEENEINLIPTWQRYIDSHLGRWFIRDFVRTNELYYEGLLGPMQLLYPKWIMNIRIQNCLTPQAHSFHIREYFESNGQLGKYVLDLPRSSLLYLYRNLKEIAANAGKIGTFNKLVDNVATPSKVPLDRYSFRHNLSDLFDNKKPDVEMHREIINFRDAGTGGNRRTVEELHRKQIPLGALGDLDIDLSNQYTRDETSASADNRTLSKVIDSQMLDEFDSVYYPLTDMIFNLWAFSAVNGLYTGSIYVTQPATGDRLQLTPLNAFILAQYCYNKGNLGIELTSVDKTLLRYIPKLDSLAMFGIGNKPTVAVMSAASDVSLFEPEVIQQIYREDYPTTLTASSSLQFYQRAKNLHAEIMRRYYICADQTYALQRAMAEDMVSRLYHYQFELKLLPQPMNYNSWLVSRGIDLSNMTDDDHIRLAADLVEKAVGFDSLDLRKKPRIQTAVMGILKYFSPYSVQFINSINVSPVIAFGWSPLRPLNEKFELIDGGEILLARVNLSIGMDLTVSYDDFDLHTLNAYDDVRGVDIQMDFSSDMLAPLESVDLLISTDTPSLMEIPTTEIVLLETDT